jgi:hypothetical protein
VAAWLVDYNGVQYSHRDIDCVAFLLMLLWFAVSLLMYLRVDTPNLYLLVVWPVFIVRSGILIYPSWQIVPRPARRALIYVAMFVFELVCAIMSSIPELDGVTRETFMFALLVGMYLLFALLIFLLKTKQA